MSDTHIKDATVSKMKLTKISRLLSMLGKNCLKRDITLLMIKRWNVYIPKERYPNLTNLLVIQVSLSKYLGAIEKITDKAKNAVTNL